jgi:hypothetical protein
VVVAVRVGGSEAELAAAVEAPVEVARAAASEVEAAVLVDAGVS